MLYLDRCVGGSQYVSMHIYIYTYMCMYVHQVKGSNSNWEREGQFGLLLQFNLRSKFITYNLYSDGNAPSTLLYRYRVLKYYALIIVELGNTCISHPEPPLHSIETIVVDMSIA